MKTTDGKPRMWRMLMALVAGVVSAASARAQGQIVVIANASIKATQISRSDLRDTFTGISEALKDGSRVAPVLLKDGSIHDLFLNLYIGKSDAAFRASWRSVLFSGQGSMPRTLGSESEVIGYVARTPGAIGYVVNVPGHEGIKILAVK